MEGMLNEYLKVTVNKVEQPYKGFMVKRGPVIKSSYHTIGAGQTDKFQVKLASGYSTELSGYYEVEFNHCFLVAKWATEPGSRSFAFTCPKADFIIM